MSYHLKRELDKNSVQAIKNLENLFSDNEWAEQYIRHHHLRCADDVENVLSLGHPKKILNIGGAPYIFEAIIKSKNVMVDSLDLDPGRHASVIEALRLNVENVNIEDPVERTKLRINDYDVLVLAEVFEHMRMDLIGTLQFLYEGMRGGSSLYLTTPNFFFLRRFLRKMKAGRSGPDVVFEWDKLKSLGHMGHVREYSRVELVELFEHVGFEVADIKYRNRRSPIEWSIKGLILTIFCAIMESTFDCFAEELIFVLRKKN